MADFERIELSGVRLDLLPSGAVWMPDAETLLVADTHFGKDATFRRHHIPVPAGATEGTLECVAKLIENFKARTLIILGDMFHARSSLAPSVRDLLTKFFDRFAAVEMILVRGNHDVHVGPLPQEWPIRNVPYYRLGSIILAHHPVELPEDADLLICGHLHPSIRIAGLTDQTGAIPCFWYSQRRLVVPAIGEFTGTHRIRPMKGDRVWMLVDGQVVEHALLAKQC